MQVAKLNGSAQIALQTAQYDDLFHLKLQWVSAKDEVMKKDLSEKIRKCLSAAR